jgi:hypothetical protein
MLHIKFTGIICFTYNNENEKKTGDFLLRNYMLETSLTKLICFLNATKLRSYETFASYCSDFPSLRHQGREYEQIRLVTPGGNKFRHSSKKAAYGLLSMISRYRNPDARRVTAFPCPSIPYRFQQVLK